MHLVSQIQSPLPYRVQRSAAHISASVLPRLRRSPPLRWTPELGPTSHDPNDTPPVRWSHHVLQLATRNGRLRSIRRHARILNRPDAEGRPFALSLEVNLEVNDGLPAPELPDCLRALYAWFPFHRTAPPPANPFIPASPHQRRSAGLIY